MNVQYKTLARLTVRGIRAIIVDIRFDCIDFHNIIVSQSTQIARGEIKKVDVLSKTSYTILKLNFQKAR